MEPQPPPISQPAPIPRKSWFGRNWAWFVPMGCLSLIAIGVLLVVGIMSMAFGLIKSSEPYKHALATGRAHPAVIDAIGTPIREGFFVSGNINASGGSGEADLQIPISGPNGKATIYVVAKKIAGNWRYETLAVKIAASGTEIDLLQASEEAAAD